MLKAFETLDEIENFTFIRDACHQNIDSKIAVFLA